MAYAIKADIQKRLDDQKLVQLTDFTNSGTMDDSRITEALDLATATIDSYAGGRYDLPLTASDQVKDLCVTIAIFKLYEGRQLVSEWAENAWTRAMKFLDDVRSGKASLDQPLKAQSTAMEATTKDHVEDPDVFDDNKLTNF